MEQVLLVDDELNIVNAFKRRLSGTYEFLAAKSGAEALTVLQANPKISVIVSDMNMPGMSGANFLSEALKKAPDAIRVMLTGLSDQRTAAKAINEGSVFRFLSKPCSVEEFEKTLQDCVHQHRLQQHERDVMQNTVGGVIALISDLLSGLDPDGTQLAGSMRRIFRELFRGFQVSTVELELAATLGGLGKLSLPLEVLLKLGQGASLESQEKHLLEKSLDTSARLLKHIPRFERVSQLLANVRSKNLPSEGLLRSNVLAFRVAEKVATTMSNTESASDALNRIALSLSDEERSFIQPLLKDGPVEEVALLEAESRYEIGIKELCPGQQLLEDIKDKNGKLLLRKGFLISSAVIERIRNHDELAGIITPLIVNQRIPTKES